MSEPQDDKTKKNVTTNKDSSSDSHGSSQANPAPRHIVPPQDFRIPPGAYC